MIAMDECGQLVWDYTRGEVVCMDTGEVVDRIYDYGPVHVGEEAREWARVEERKRLRRYGYRADRELRRLKHRLRKHYRLLRLARSITSRGYMVDEERLLRQGRFVLTVYSRKSIEVLDWFEKKGLRPVLDRIIGVLGEVEPLAINRSIRGRYLLSYIVYELLRGRYTFSYRDLDGLKPLVSETTFNRLLRIARSIINKHKTLLEEAVGNE